MIDIYINAAIVGFTYNKKASEDKTSNYKEEKTTIFAEQMIKESATIEFIYRMIMLLEERKTVPLEDRVNRAFRDDSLDDVSNKHQKNMEIFGMYVLGGIEILYEKILGRGVTEEDFMKNAYEFMKEKDMYYTSENADKVLEDLL